MTDILKTIAAYTRERVEEQKKLKPFEKVKIDKLIPCARNAYP
jgi:hypothetical protein